MNWDMPTYYTYQKRDSLRFKFKNSERIQQNHSQCYQDMFVLSCADGKTEGRYIEIGAGHPHISNNTMLLELFGWKGVGLDIRQHEIELYSEQRKNFIADGDATKVDYVELLQETELDYPTFDYLQVDCDPPRVSFNALKKIPHDKYKFAAITFEHDKYTSEDGELVQTESREFLTNLGYVLVVDDISVDDSHPFEDWWAHPDLVSSSIIDKMKCITGETKKAEDYMLGRF